MKTARTRTLTVLVRAALTCAIGLCSSADSPANEVDQIVPFLTQISGATSIRYPEGTIAIAFQDIQAGGNPATDEQRAAHLSTTKLTVFLTQQQNFKNAALSSAYPIWTKRFSVDGATYIRVVVACCELLSLHQSATIAMLEARWPEAERNFGSRLTRAYPQGGSPQSVTPSLIAPFMAVPSMDALLAPSKPTGADR